MRIIGGEGTLQLTDDELRAVTNALNEVCHGPDAIHESEFHTRMGVERSEAQALLDALLALSR